MSVSKKLINNILSPLDNIYLRVDKRNIRRTKNIRLIPNYKFRKGGKLSYAEWAHVIGIFQTIIYQTLERHTGNRILDIGCGTGLVGIASEPFISDKGKYLGIDVVKGDLEFCRANLQGPNFDFKHLKTFNAMYAKDEKNVLKYWDVEGGSFDLVTALSVWTHLDESQSRFYFKEIARSLKKGGKAIITFFYLDNLYEESLGKREDNVGRYHLTNQKEWIFETNAYGSEEWYCPKWVKVPEDAIGVTEKGMKMMLEESGLKIAKYYPGNWKEIPGIFFQDIIILEK